jgi:hypothetical protein
MAYVHAQTFVVNYSLKYPHLQFANAIEKLSFYLNFKPSISFFLNFKIF